MIRPSISFPLGDVITGEPHLTVRQPVSCHEEEQPELQLRTSAAMHLPRIILTAWGAAGLLLWLTGMAAAAN